MSEPGLFGKIGAEEVGIEAEVVDPGGFARLPDPPGEPDPFRERPGSRWPGE